MSTPKEDKDKNWWYSNENQWKLAEGAYRESRWNNPHERITKAEWNARVQKFMAEDNWPKPHPSPPPLTEDDRRLNDNFIKAFKEALKLATSSTKLDRK